MKLIKRILLALAAVVVLLVLVVGGVIASAFLGNDPLPESAELPGGARLIKDGFVAAFVLPAGGNDVALIDCGNDPDAKAILAELKRRGSDRESVKEIFLTHGHGDHTAGCHQFPNADVMAFPGDIELAAGTKGGPGLITKQFKNGPLQRVTVTHPLHDGSTIQLGDLSVRVFAIPGHTDGSAAYLARGVLYLGDSATNRKDGTFAGAAKVTSVDSAQNHASLRALWKRIEAEHLEVKFLAPAHSAPREGTESYEAFAHGND